MSNNYQIRPSVARVGDRLIETYERKSNATNESLESLGLDPNADNYAQVGITAINEYIRLIATGIKKGEAHSWKIADIGQDIEIDSIYIDTPNADSFDLEIYGNNGSKLLDLTVGRYKAPYDLPNAILTQNLTLQVVARADIGMVLINCRPAVLLKDFYATPPFKFEDNQPG